MISKTWALCAISLLAWSVHAQPAPAAHAHNHTHESAQKSAPVAPAVELSKHAKQDIQRHRGMAQAHEKAAQCLESGGSHDSCQQQLQVDCKGLAIGKSCGMRHAH